jgi:membrane associated rhomboid family serine protease
MKEVAQTLKNQVLILGSMVAAMWLVMAVNVGVFGGKLNGFGIVPHQMSGIPGILFAPVLHGSWQHLISNTTPFIILGWFVMLWETTDIVVVTISSMLVGGIGTWLFGGANTVHIGASGVVFGYLGYLLLRGYFTRQISAILVSIFVFAVYGSVLVSMAPTTPGISWQGHLFGFLGGAITAKLCTPAQN